MSYFNSLSTSADVSFYDNSEKMRADNSGKRGSDDTMTKVAHSGGWRPRS